MWEGKERTEEVLLGVSRGTPGSTGGDTERRWYDVDTEVGVLGPLQSRDRHETSQTLGRDLTRGYL